MGVHVHSLNKYSYPEQKKVLLYHTQRDGNFSLKSGQVFRRESIFQDFAQIYFAPLVLHRVEPLIGDRSAKLKYGYGWETEAQYRIKGITEFQEKLKSKTPFKSWFYPVGLGGDGQHAPQGEGQQEAEAGQPQRQARHLRPVNLIILRTKIMHKNVLQH